MTNPRDPGYWSTQNEQARLATQGINEMPGVFSNYSAIPGLDASQVKKLFFPGDGQIGLKGGQNIPPLQQMVGGAGGGGLGGPAPNSLLGMDLQGLLANPWIINAAITGNMNPLTGKPLTPAETSLLTQAGSQLQGGSQGGGFSGAYISQMTGGGG